MTASHKAGFDLESRSGSQLPVDFPEKVRQRLAKAFEAELTAMPGIETALTALTSAICVASSSTPERVRYALSLVGLLHHFDPHIFSASQVVRGKPAPDLFLFAAGQMDFKPSACLVVEDSVAGVTAANAAGMRVVGFTGGSHCGPGHSACLRQAGAFATIAGYPPARLGLAPRFAGFGSCERQFRRREPTEPKPMSSLSVAKSRNLESTAPKKGSAKSNKSSRRKVPSTAATAKKLPRSVESKAERVAAAS